MRFEKNSTYHTVKELLPLRAFCIRYRCCQRVTAVTQLEETTFIKRSVRDFQMTHLPPHFRSI